MRRLISAGLMLFFTLSAQASEWKSLFNGKDLTGWEHVGSGSFVVENGLLKTQGGMGLLYWTGGKIGRSVIRVVFRAEHGNDNSGVYVRIPLKPVEPWMPVFYGSEVQIDSEPERWSAEHKYSTGSLYSQTYPLEKAPLKEWNTMDITIDGPRTVVHVNGVKVTDHREGDPVKRLKNDLSWRLEPRANEGYIGLQNHGDKDTVYFKEVSVRKLK